MGADAGVGAADPGPVGRRALDIGCAVGRATFEMARVCNESLGIDYSSAFIRAAQTLQRGEEIVYATPLEGDLKRERTARMPAGIDPARVQFEVGDAERLSSDLGAFDYVLAANLICRLRTPRHFLDQLPALVKPGGYLLLATPASWTQIYTPRENWIGGYESPQGPVRTLDGIRRILDRHFELDLRVDLPLLILEHERKYELIVSEATRWRRR
jgi:putative 4-mercaptohistidine N1-methyltranferase